MLDTAGKGGVSAGAGATVVADADAAAATAAAASSDASGLPVVLVHGFAQSARTWDEVVRRLAALGYVPAPFELAGHGKRKLPENPSDYALEAQAGELLAYVRRVGGGAPVAVVGYSMGGRVALVAARRNPSAFSALVLESTGLGLADGDDRHALERRNRGWARRLRAEGAAPFAEWWGALPLFATQQGLPPDVRNRLRAERADNDAEALARTLEEAGGHTMPASSESLRTLRELAVGGAAMLYVAGALDEKYRACAKQVRDALDGLPSAQVAIIENAGHNVHLEQPEAFVAALAAVLHAAGSDKTGSTGSLDRGMPEEKVDWSA